MLNIFILGYYKLITILMNISLVKRKREQYKSSKDLINSNVNGILNIRKINLLTLIIGRMSKYN